MFTRSDFFDAYAVIGQSIGAHPRLPWSLDALQAQMRLCGVSRALVAQREGGGMAIWQRNLELFECLPDCCAAIGDVQPGDAGDFPEMGEWISVFKSSRVAAVRISPKTNFWNPLGGAAAELFDALSSQSWPVYVALEFEVSHAEFELLANRFPSIKWVATGGSWTRQRDVCSLARRCPNSYFTLEAYHANWGVEHLLSLGVGGRLLFASAAPAKSMGAARAMIDWLDAPAAERQLIASGNLERMLPYVPNEGLCDLPLGDNLIQAAQAGKPLPCEVLDAHAHILDDGQHSGGSQVMLRGDAEGMLAMADRLGVDQMGVMTWRGIQGAEQDAGHIPVVAAVERWPKRFWGLATIHVRDKSDAQKVNELEALCQDRRIIGIKPYPTLGLPYDHPRFAALWKYAEASGLYVGMHPFHWYRPDEFSALCTRYPKLKILAYHAGASYEIADTVISLCRKFSNLYAEINYSTVTGGVIEYLVEGCGANRVVYGTDQPMRDPRPQLGWVLYTNLDIAVKAQILAGNLRVFLQDTPKFLAVHDLNPTQSNPTFAHT